MTLQIIAAFSLGVHVLAFLALGLVADGNEHARAYRRFVGAVSLWILLVLLTAMGVAVEVSRPLAGAVAHFLPVIFLLSAALRLPPLSRRTGIFVVVAAALLLPFTVDASPWKNRELEIAYYAVTLGAVAFRILQGFRAGRVTETSVQRRVVAAWLLAVPLAAVLLVAVGAVAAIPLLLAALQAVVLYAMVRLSLYQVRAGASRSGTLASDAAEHDRRAIAGEIVAIVAHEVRNPLTGVRSLAQRLADDTVDDERRRHYAGVIVREVDRVERMVGALLGASGGRAISGTGMTVRAGTGTGAVGDSTRAGAENVMVSDTSLGELFGDVALLVSGRYRRAGVQLVVEPSALVSATPREPLAQVLLNLLLNAVVQAPPQGRVRIYARTAGMGQAEVIVEDNGPGVPAAERNTIFSPFHSGTGGSGLGLAVVRRLCDEWGWSVRVTDTPGGGATFIVAVPL